MKFGIILNYEINLFYIVSNFFMIALKLLAHGFFDMNVSVMNIF